MFRREIEARARHSPRTRRRRGVGLARYSRRACLSLATQNLAFPISESSCCWWFIIFRTTDKFAQMFDDRVY